MIQIVGYAKHPCYYQCHVVALFYANWCYCDYLIIFMHLCAVDHLMAYNAINRGKTNVH